jgi:glutamate-1-semialdehyde 2,1-aminomutase
MNSQSQSQRPLSQELFQRALKVAPGGVHSPVRAFASVGGEPIFFKSAKGAYLYSVDGQRYIDFCQSFGPNILGHLDDDVLGEVRSAIEEAWSLGACEPYSLKLAEWITNRLGFVEKIRFVCSGTEAVMSALRVARGFTGRDRVLKFEGCYHGHVDSLLVKAGSGLATLATADSAGVSEQTAHDTLVIPLNDEAALEKVFREQGNTLAAVILEPLPANYGLLLQRPEYWRRVCELAKAHGALVIFDEVISGFRVGLGGMAEDLGIRPDLVTYGKIMGGGFPVGAYGGRAELMNLVAPAGPVYQAGTLAGNPVGMRAGLATLEKIERENVYQVLKDRTEKFCAGLESRFRELDLPIRVARYASIFWLHLETGEVIRSPTQFHAETRARFKALFLNAIQSGVYLAPSAFEVGFVSFAHTEEILAQAQDILVRAAREAYGR